MDGDSRVFGCIASFWANLTTCQQNQTKTAVKFKWMQNYCKYVVILSVLVSLFYNFLCKARINSAIFSDILVFYLFCLFLQQLWLFQRPVHPSIHFLYQLTSPSQGQCRNNRDKIPVHASKANCYECFVVKANKRWEEHLHAMFRVGFLDIELLQKLQQ